MFSRRAHCGRSWANITTHAAAAFGANLVGAMVGGFVEYLSMATGSRSLVVVVTGAYLVSLAAIVAAQRDNSLADARTEGKVVIA